MTHEEFQAALDAGYDLFPRLLFARPVIVHGHQIPVAKIACMRMLSRDAEHDLDFAKAGEDHPGGCIFPIQMLKYAKLALFHFRTDIRSIDHAFGGPRRQNIRTGRLRASDAGAEQACPSS